MREDSEGERCTEGRRYLADFHSDIFRQSLLLDIFEKSSTINIDMRQRYEVKKLGSFFSLIVALSLHRTAKSGSEPMRCRTLSRAWSQPLPSRPSSDTLSNGSFSLLTFLPYVII